MESNSFADIAIVTCGTLSLEINHLKEEGFLDEYMAEHPEELLEYSDWMGIPIMPYPVSLDRFKYLLMEGIEQLKK